MSQVTVFVLDTTLGTPAQGIPIALEQQAGNRWRTVAAGTTDRAGCIRDFVPAELVLPAGRYRLFYDVKDYFSRRHIASLFPEIVVRFSLAGDRRYVLPLLLGPHSYMFYRGS